MAIDYNAFYVHKKGAAYRADQLSEKTRYSYPVEKTAGRPYGNSRVWGDAPLAHQRIIIDAVVTAGKKAGFNIRRLALLLAMVHIESGFNLDAAAGTTSASGLGQFIRKTGKAYGLTDDNAFDLAPNISALIAYFKENEGYVRKNKKPDVWVYKYHHDGPFQDSGGEALTNNKFAPLAARFEKALNVGHTVAVVDPVGAPIADAHVKVMQNGKTAILKTNEKGLLPPIMANPDFGPIVVFIKKANDEFKQLGELAIASLGSAWTVIAPKQKFPIKTYVHEKKPGPPSSQPGIHKVVQGETISRIARDHGTSYQELAKLNGIEKPYLIFPGQKLKLPPAKGPKAAAKPPAPAKPAAPAPAKTAAPAAAKPAAPVAPVRAAAAPSAAAKPVVVEKRSAETTHPEAKVVRTQVSDRIAATIAYALSHKEAKSIGYCLRYVKRALVAGGLFAKYPGCAHAKDFNPFLQKEGFKDLLPDGVNLETAPVGSVIIYRPVEKQSHNGKTISGHIEIKHPHGYVSDFSSPRPVYRTNPVTMVSPVHAKYGVTFKVTGIWYKE